MLPVSRVRDGMEARRHRVRPADWTARGQGGHRGGDGNQPGSLKGTPSRDAGSWRSATIWLAALGAAPAEALMLVLRTVGLFVVTAVAEIVGCYLAYLWLRRGQSVWLLVPAALSLAAFAWLLTMHPAATGRV